MFQEVFPAILLENNNVIGFCRHIKQHGSSFECMNYFNERENLIKIKKSMTLMSSMNNKLKKAVSSLVPMKVLFIYYIYNTPFYAI